MERPVFIGAVLACLLSCAAPARPDFDRISSSEIAQVVAASDTIICNRSAGDMLVGYDCIQTFDKANARHFAALSLKVTRAQGAWPAGGPRLVSTSFGPGGGGSTFKGRTRDGAYDVTATEMQSLTEEQQTRLPTAAAFITRMLAAYDAPEPQQRRKQSRREERSQWQTI